MLGRALSGALGGCGSLRSALCRIASSEGNKADPPGWVSTLSSQWPSANGGGSASLRTLYIEAWKSDDASSSDGGSSGVGPEAEQSNAEEADSLSASTAAPAEVVSPPRFPWPQSLLHPAVWVCSYHRTVRHPSHAKSLIGMWPAGAKGETAPAPPCRDGQLASA